MRKHNFKNMTLERSLEEILKYNTIATKGSVSGNSIEVMEGNAYTSFIYYDDEKSRNEDLDILNNLLQKDTQDKPEIENLLGVCTKQKV